MKRRKQNTAPPSAGKMAWLRFRKDKQSKFALWVIGILVFIALFADFLAYQKPLYAQYQGKTYFPLFKDYLVDLGLDEWPADMLNKDWKSMELESAVWAPVRWGQGQQDLRNFRRTSPFGEQKVKHWKDWHYLGTDDLGRDVLAGLIHGTRKSMLVGLVVAVIALLIGVPLGALSGYLGDNGLKLPRMSAILLVLFLPIAWFYAFDIRSDILAESMHNGGISFAFNILFSLVLFAGILVIALILGKPFRRLPWIGKLIAFPLDSIIMRVAETIMIIPALLVLMAIMGIVGNLDVFVLMVVIGLIGWTGIMRLTRAEFLRNRELEYVQAARSLGYSDFRIIFRHVLPNSLSPVWVSVAFILAGAILTEAAFSFIFPRNEPSWGSMLSEAKHDINAWWLGIFPGFAIFATVTLFNLLGEGLSNALDPKKKT